MQAFVPRNRRPKFLLSLTIFDLNNVPLVSGASFIKWDLPHSAAGEHRGRTSKCSIREHAVQYEYAKTVQVRLTVDKNNHLQDAYINFEVLQEYSTGARGERILLGTVRLNLAEYVQASEAEEGEEGIVRRYLMRDSKINSTLKIGIRMQLLEGDQNFTAPALKTAPVFGGIAGIMAGEQADAEDIGHMPSLSSKTREAGEAQDLYRRNLAAFIHALPGELRADECIEDIFAGGDGWSSSKDRPQTAASPADKPSWRKRSGYDDHVRDAVNGHSTSHGRDAMRNASRSQSPRRSSSSGPPSRSSNHRGMNLHALTPLNPDGNAAAPQPSQPSGLTPSRPNSRHSHSRSHSHHAKHDDVVGVHGGRTSLAQNAKNIRSDNEGGGGVDMGVKQRAAYELDEFEVRDDLRSWSIRGNEVVS